MDRPVVQGCLPKEMLENRPLPGIAPLGADDWIMVDDAYAGQMAERRARIADDRPRVMMRDPAAEDALAECLDMALAVMARRPDLGFVRDGDAVICPDGARIVMGDPLQTLARLLQEDLCILQKRGEEHVLTAAALCFPASWSLAEKFMRPLSDIHVPVQEYDADIARRVQRLFDGVRAGRPLWRFNRLWYHDPALFQPRSANDRRVAPPSGQAGYLRSERQCILRLPDSDAVLFSIHTFVVPRMNLPAGFSTDGPSVA